MRAAAVFTAPKSPRIMPRSRVPLSRKRQGPRQTRAATHIGISRLCSFNLRADLINHRATGVIPESVDFWYCAVSHAHHNVGFRTQVRKIVPARDRHAPAATPLLSRKDVLSQG
jgi:hypothetical protein